MDSLLFSSIHGTSKNDNMLCFRENKCKFLAAAEVTLALFLIIMYKFKQKSLTTLIHQNTFACKYQIREK